MSEARFSVRDERVEDAAAIHRVIERAFGQPLEADLVDALRRSDALTVSMVAERDGEVVGHIAFSPVTIRGSDATRDALGLAPLAVLPEHRGRGIGSMPAETAAMDSSYSWVSPGITSDSASPPRFSSVSSAPFRCPPRCFSSRSSRPARSSDAPEP